MANNIDLKAFAAAYHGEDSEGGAEITAYLGKLGKKVQKRARLLRVGSNRMLA